MKNLPLREVLLLLLPVLGLGIFAWKLQVPRVSDQIAPQNGFTVEIEEVKVGPATPREVYEGFDTRVSVRFKAPSFSSRPDWQQIGFFGAGAFIQERQLVVPQKDGWKPVFPDTSIWYIETTPDNQLIYSLRLHDLPVMNKDLFFRGNFFAPNVYFSTPDGQRRLMAKPQPISVRVRKAGQKVNLVPTSRWQPFRFASFEVKKVPHQEAHDFEDTILHVLVEKIVDDVVSHKDFSSRFEWVDPHLENAQGERLKFRPGPGAGMQKWRSPEVRFDPNTEKGPYAFPVRITMWRVLPKTGPVIFKGALSYNDGWPLPISVVLRKK